MPKKCSGVLLRTGKAILGNPCKAEDSDLPRSRCSLKSARVGLQSVTQPASIPQLFTERHLLPGSGACSSESESWTLPWGAYLLAANSHDPSKYLCEISRELWVWIRDPGPGLITDVRVLHLSKDLRRSRVSLSAFGQSLKLAMLQREMKEVSIFFLFRKQAVVPC